MSYRYELGYLTLLLSGKVIYLLGLGMAKFRENLLVVLEESIAFV